MPEFSHQQIYNSPTSTGIQGSLFTVGWRYFTDVFTAKRAEARHRPMAGTGESKINELRWWLMNIHSEPSCNSESIILNMMMNPWSTVYDCLWITINGLMIDSGLFCWRCWCFFDLDMLLDWRVGLRGQMLRWNEGCVATNNGRGHYGSHPHNHHHHHHHHNHHNHHHAAGKHQTSPLCTCRQWVQRTILRMYKDCAKGGWSASWKCVWVYWFRGPSSTTMMNYTSIFVTRPD